MTARGTALIAAVVAAHTAVTAVHAAAHLSLSILPAALDLAFIAVIIFAAPIVAAVLRWRGPRRAADSLLAGSLGASLIYGLASHVVLPGADNVASLPGTPWGGAFAATAVAIAALEAVGVAVAVFDLRRG